MIKKIKIPAEVLEQMEEQNPQMAEEVKRLMDDEGRIEVWDDDWDRQNEEKEPSLPEYIKIGLAVVGDLIGWKRDN